MALAMFFVHISFSVGTMPFFFPGCFGVCKKDINLQFNGSFFANFLNLIFALNYMCLHLFFFFFIIIIFPYVLTLSTEKKENLP